MQANKQSDIDLLIILKEAPQAYYKRLQPILEVREGLSRRSSYRKFERDGLYPYLSFLVLTEEESNENRYIFLDMIDSSIILFDRADFFKKRLDEIKVRLRELGAKRVLLEDGSWYWDLKPDLVPGEVFEL
ncbi:MAG: nucleotidyltransferase domain-containing protein [Nitrospirota bacterium]